jgi:hypothetical protein
MAIGIVHQSLTPATTVTRARPVLYPTGFLLGVPQLHAYSDSIAMQIIAAHAHSTGAARLKDRIFLAIAQVSNNTSNPANAMSAMPTT